MPIIRAGKYPTEAVKRWLDANGVRWYIPQDAEIVVKGNVAHTERFLFRVDDREKLRANSASYDRRVFEFEDGQPVAAKTRPYRFRVRFPLSNYLNG